MRKGGGKSKGSSFERTVCKLLSLWVSDGESTDLFWRSAGSGSRATKRSKAKIEVEANFGDIVAVRPPGFALTDRFFVECKHHNNLRVVGLLLRSKGPLRKFWVKTQRHAARYGRSPMLIARQNKFPIFVLTEEAATWSGCNVILPKLCCKIYVMDDLVVKNSFLPCHAMVRKLPDG